MDPLKILIAEDNPEDGHLLEHRIKVKLTDAMPVDIHIVIVRTLAEALTHAATATVSILDLNLLDASADDLIAAIPFFTPPVIIMTGDCDPKIHARCKMAGASDVFMKGHLGGLCRAILRAMSKKVLLETGDK